MSIAALETYLAPIRVFIEKDGVNEVCINRPGEVWTEIKGTYYHDTVPDLTLNHLMSLGRLIAQSTAQEISEERPLLSATLPEGYRVQIVFPPGCEVGTVAVAIRKSNPLQMDLDEYEALGAFQSTTTKEQKNPVNIHLKQLMDEGRIKEFLIAAVQAKKNIVISGGTSTGKTTFANALFRAIPLEERLITVEDAREIMLPHPNRVHLMVSKGAQGRARVTVQDQIEACLRLAPSRIIVGELRGAEAFSFLRAVNTGHPGSIATLHADTPALAIEQLTMMVMQAGLGLERQEIKHYIENVVDIVVQLKKGDRGRRYVSEVYFNHEK